MNRAGAGLGARQTRRRMANVSHGTLEHILAAANGEPLAAMCVTLRKRITSLHKEFVETVWPKQKIARYGVAPRR